MNHYRIQFTLNTKIRGNNNYIKDYHFRGGDFKGFWWDDPELIFRIGERIDFNPTVVDIELFAKSNLLDLIQN